MKLLYFVTLIIYILSLYEAYEFVKKNDLIISQHAIVLGAIAHEIGVLQDKGILEKPHVKQEEGNGIPKS